MADHRMVLHEIPQRVRQFGVLSGDGWEKVSILADMMRGQSDAEPMTVQKQFTGRFAIRHTVCHGLARDMQGFS